MGKICMNKKSTGCADLELTTLGLCSLQERNGGKANDNLGNSVNCFTSYKERWAFVPGRNAATKEDVHEYIRRIMKLL